MPKKSRATVNRRRAPRKTSAARRTPPLKETLGRLERVELVRRAIDEELAYLFKHALVQDTVYSSLLRNDRKQLHRRVAESLELEFRANLDRVAARLAQHYAQAEDDAKTLEYATRAGDAAARVYANAEAVENYSLALRVAASGAATHEQLLHLFTKRGRVLELGTDAGRALENYDEMRQVARARRDRLLELHSLVLRGTILSTPNPLFNPTEAHRLSTEALELARSLGDRAAEARVLWNLHLLSKYMGDPARSIEYGEQALALARAHASPELQAFILDDLSGPYMSRGQMALAREASEEARALWLALDDQPMLANNLMMAGTQALMQGDYDRALEFTAQGIEITRRIDNVVGQMSNIGTRVGVQAERGEYADALSLIEENLRLAQRAHQPLYRALGHSMVAWLQAICGACESAREMARRARDDINDSLPFFFRTWSLAGVARTYIACGDLDAASAAMRELEQYSTTELFSPSVLLGSIAAGEFALANGEYAKAGDKMKEFAAELRRSGIRAYYAEALYFRARALRAQGDAKQAEEILQQACDEAQAVGTRRVLWQILAALSELKQARGNLVEAQVLRTRARAEIELLVEHMPPEYRTSFLNLPAVRRVLIEDANAA